MISWPVKPKNKKYEIWYNNLISKSKNRTLTGYTEKHHIIPRSFGGTNNKNNIAILTAREHYIAHALLWKMKFEGVYGSKMAFAFNTFISKMTTKERKIHHTYKISSRMYEIFRKQYSLMLKEKYAQEGGTFLGKKHTEQTKKKIGEKSKLKEFKRGSEHFNYGKPSFATPEGRARQIAAIKERWADPEFKKMMLEKHKAFFKTPEGIAQRKAASDRMKGVKRDPSSIEKTAAAKRGKTWKELYTPDQINRMRNSIINRTLTEDAQKRIKKGAYKGSKAPMPEHVKKQVSERFKNRTDIVGEKNGMYGKKHSSESILKMKETISKRPLIECPHCGKQSKAKSQMVRWHFENCKEK